MRDKKDFQRINLDWATTVFGEAAQYDLEVIVYYSIESNFNQKEMRKDAGKRKYSAV